jgi:hypothetical protein
MPTYISNYLFTGISHSTVLNASLETPITVNDSFVVGTPLFFGVSSIKYNQLRSSMGQSAIIDFSLYTMTVFLCDSIDPSNDSFINVRKIKQFVLGNVVNQYQYQNISNVFEDFSNNDVLLDSMTANEIKKLKKSFKLIFRINLTSNIITTQSIQTGDLIQNFNLITDAMQPGPYEVNFEHIDIVSPKDFTDSERLSFYQNNINAILHEGIRCFYPKNISSLAPIPLVTFVRANACFIESHDVYLNLLASYGYFCISIPVDVSGSDVTIFDNGILDYIQNPWYFTGLEINTFSGTGGATISWGYMHLGIIDHIQKNISKISSGKFNNQIDFTKIIPMGHSRGGGSIIGLYQLLQYKLQANNLIEHLNTNISTESIKCLIPFTPGVSEVIQSDGSIAQIAQPVTNPNFSNTIIPPAGGDVNFTQRYYTYTRGISQPQFYRLNSDNVQKLKFNINVPTLLVYPELDNDVPTIAPLMYRCLNLNSTGNITARKKFLCIKKLPHNGVGIPPPSLWTTNGLLSSKYQNFKNTNGIILNSLSSRIRYLASKVLYFISESVYNHALNQDIITNTVDFDDRYESLGNCVDITEFTEQNKIINYIDDFSTKKYTTDIIGATIGLCLSKKIISGLSFISESGFTLAPELCAKGLLFMDQSDNRGPDITFENDPFGRIYSGQNKGLLFSFNSSQNIINYNYSPSTINLSGASFIHIDIGQLPGSTFNIDDNKNLHFCLGIKDNNNQEVILSTFNYNNGAPDPCFYEISGITYWSFTNLAPIKFRLQDFEMKNQLLNLSTIESITLYFGSLAGTTFGSAYIDGIYATG